MSDLIKKAKRIIFVPKCKCCGKTADRENLCDACRGEMEKGKIPADKIQINKKYEFVNKVYSSYYYKSIAGKAVTRAKFTNPAAFLNSLLTDISIDIQSVLRENNIDMIMSVPYHKSKLYEREYDLPQEMAKRLAKHFSIGYCIPVKKIKKTANQHDLRLKERKINLAGAFEAEEDAAGKNILIVDDVITTGTTVSAVASALKMAGAENVYVWTYTYNT